MKNAIIVSLDAAWRTITEGTLLAKGWRVASVESIVPGDYPDPASVHAVVVDSASIDSSAIASWLGAMGTGLKVPLIMAPGLKQVEALADAMDLPTPTPEGRSDVVLRFWGVRGSIPAPGPRTSFYGGNTSCVELEVEGQVIILDAGSGIRSLGNSLMARAAAANKKLDIHLLISHTHWDHIQGLPFFVPAYVPTNHLRVVGYKAVCHHLSDVLARQMDPAYFPISMEDMPSHPEVEEVDDHFECGPVKVEAFFTNHPGRCAGFRFETRAGAVVYISDNELNHEGQATHLPTETTTHMYQRLINTIRGARVLIHDAQYTLAEYQTKVGWGHSAFEDVIEMAAAAEVEHLYFFHHDPVRSDEELNRMVQQARETARAKGWRMRIDAAREGLEISL
ncbi:MAG: MBL fold metallo-hydrolase [Verrucomicrobia bacterium]|nr:MBL fold metallo-hydrolase [Verrucomicrobiota bacterium]